MQSPAGILYIQHLSVKQPYVFLFIISCFAKVSEIHYEKRCALAIESFVVCVQNFNTEMCYAFQKKKKNN